MKSLFFSFVFFLLIISINAQNGTYRCKRQEHSSFSENGNKISYNDCIVTIQIYGIGRNDFVKVEMQSDNSKDTITYKWDVKTEIQMAPDAKGKRIFNSYTATMNGEEDENSIYQITIIKRNKRKKIAVAAINVDGETNWFYDLEKIE